MRAILGASALAVALPAAAQTPASAFDYSIANVVPGQWTYSPAAAGGNSSFATVPGQPLLTVRCDRARRQVSIARTATGAAPFLFVWSSAMTRNVPAGYDPATKLLTGQLSASDKLLDALAFSRGRIVVGATTAGTLVAPAWPDVARVVEDCRV